MLASPALLAPLVGALASVPLPPRFAADADDAYALRENPAGLGVLRGRELRLVFGHQLGASGDAGGVNGFAAYGAANLWGAPLSVGAAYEVELLPGADDPGRGVVGFGFGGASGGLGVAHERLSVGGTTRSAWTAGVMLRPASWLSAAFVARDLAEHLGARTYDLGLALRPGTDRLLLAARWRLTDGYPVFGDRQDLAVRAEVEPIDGVFLGGGASWRAGAAGEGPSGFGLLASVRVALEAVSVGAAVRGDPAAPGLAAEVALTSRPGPAALARDRVATLQLSGELVPAPSFRLLGGGFEATPYGGVPLLLDALARADHVAGVFLNIAPLEVGWGRAQELRDRILALRAAGRRVDCHLVGTGDLEYFIASACTTILVPAPTTLAVNGVAARAVFLAEALDRAGVDIAVERRGAYKSAPEALTRMGMSVAQREALGAYLDGVHQALVEGIAAGRRLPRAAVEAAIARGTLTATEAVALGLVDRAVYPDELEPTLAGLHAAPVAFAEASKLTAPARVGWSDRTKIAVVHVDATIAGGPSRRAPFGGATAGAETIVQALEAAREDPAVAAVVLRVDSPGGDAFASDLIARAVQRTDAVKPVVASFGDTAASGGYYVAAPARAIYAEPTTLTGSIGVFSVQASVERLLGRLGIASEALARGPFAASGSPLGPIDPAAQALMRREVDVAYRAFLEVVARGRRKSVEAVRGVAEGRIWSGAEAQARGLVDELGGLTDAVARARAEAGLGAEPVELLTLPADRAEPSLPVRVARALVGTVVPEPAPFTLEDLVPHAALRALAPFLAAASAGAGDRPLALLPFALEVD